MLKTELFRTVHPEIRTTMNSSYNNRSPLKVV